MDHWIRIIFKTEKFFYKRRQNTLRYPDRVYGFYDCSNFKENFTRILSHLVSFVQYLFLLHKTTISLNKSFLVYSVSSKRPSSQHDEDVRIII